MTQVRSRASITGRRAVVLLRNSSTLSSRISPRVRAGKDLVLGAELMGHARLQTTRGYALPTDHDRQRATDSLPTDR